MKLVRACIIAFSTYSRIPCPNVEWSEENSKYSTCFFPLIGAVIGGILILWKMLCDFLGLNSLIFAGVAVYIPIFITGGLHLDGFCDTIDARASYKPKEKRLEILKDPNAGAFAVIKTCAYFVLCFAFFTAVTLEDLYILAFGFVISRAFSGIGIVNLRSARDNGMLRHFQSTSHKKIVTVVLVGFLAISVVAMLFINWILAVVMSLCAVLTFVYYRVIAYREFGGVTGDLNGYFLQISELTMLIFVVIVGSVMKLWI